MTAVVDAFSGPGGWDEGANAIGIYPVGLELDGDACATRRERGHATVQTDVAALDPDLWSCDGFIASPPCQPFSGGGAGEGRAEERELGEAVRAIARREDPRGRVWRDPRSALVLEPLRWVLAIYPTWTTWEQVPPVLPLWKACAAELAAVGYSVWTGILSAEEYGVPQTRKRAVLMARRDGKVARPPEPTHQAYVPGGHIGGELETLFGTSLQPWVSMADALGWGMTERPSVTVPSTSGAGGPRALDGGSGARAILQGEVARGAWKMRANKQTNAAVRGADEPAPTITGGHDTGDRVWISETGAVRVTVEEAAILQTFPKDYPWRGSLTSQFQQIGNAVPPLLAQRILEAVTS